MKLRKTLWSKHCDPGCLRSSTDSSLDQWLFLVKLTILNSTFLCLFCIRTFIWEISYPLTLAQSNTAASIIAISQECSLYRSTLNLTSLCLTFLAAYTFIHYLWYTWKQRRQIFWPQNSTEMSYKCIDAITNVTPGIYLLWACVKL